MRAIDLELTNAEVEVRALEARLLEGPLELRLDLEGPGHLELAGDRDGGFAHLPFALP